MGNNTSKYGRCRGSNPEVTAELAEGCAIAAPSFQWTLEEASSADLSKKALIEYMLEVMPEELKTKHKITKSAVKKMTKDNALLAYTELLAGGVVAEAAAPEEEKVKKKKEVKYKKKILKKGKGPDIIPKKGNTVYCHYKGMLEDGTIFDQSSRGKKAQPLSFKVGEGKVIKGWDQALMTMQIAEVAQITIEPEWAYGAKPPEGSKIPPN